MQTLSYTLTGKLANSTVKRETIICLLLFFFFLQIVAISTATKSINIVANHTSMGEHLHYYDYYYLHFNST